MLIGYAAKHCNAFSLTKFKGFRYEQSATDLERNLKPYLNESYLGLGTVGNYQKGSKVHQYFINNITLQILYSVNGLFEWKSPELLEDLILYIKGVYWLRTVTHENLVFLNPLFTNHNKWAIQNLHIYVPEIKC